MDLSGIQRLLASKKWETKLYHTKLVSESYQTIMYTQVCDLLVMSLSS